MTFDFKFYRILYNKLHKTFSTRLNNGNDCVFDMSIDKDEGIFIRQIEKEKRSEYKEYTGNFINMNKEATEILYEFLKSIYQ